MARALAGLGISLCTLAAIAATTADLDRGITWLSGRVLLDGTVSGEATSRGSPFQSRVETLTTLRLLATPPTPLADRVSQDPTAAVEILARKTTALVPLGRDVSASITALIARQNPDGGFGGAMGYRSNPLDTAYALRALKAAAPSSPAVGTAIAYMQSAQSADGSFPIGGEASFFATAEAVQAMALFASSQPVAGSIAAARGWLLVQQQQGSYNDALKNSVAILALLSSSSDTTGLPGPVGALTAAQAENGSWGRDSQSSDPQSGDPFVTALALRALGAAAEVLPVASTGQVNGTVVDKATGTPIEGAAITLSGAGSSGGATDFQGAFSIGNLAVGNYTLQVSKSGYSTGSVSISVVAGATTRVGTIRLETASTTATLLGIVHDGVTGQPLAAATISVVPGATATSAPDGSFRIEGLAPGSVTITVSKAGYENATAALTLQANVVYSFSPTLYPPGQGTNATSVKGKVVDATTTQPLAGAAVQVGTLGTTTNATGDFLLDGLAAGSATLVVSKAGYQSATFNGTLASGVNDVGTIVLQASASSLTLSGRISDAVTGLPIGGATVALQSLPFTGTTNSNGNYTIAGIDRTQFTLEVGAAGYQAKLVPVSLSTMADAVVDVTLAKVPSGAVSLKRVATNLPSYPPYSTIEVEAELANSGSQPADVHLRAAVRDALGNTVLQMGNAPATIPGNTAALELELEAHNENLAAGTYSLVVGVYDGADALLAEGSASFQITASTQVAGDVTLDPPILQTGANTPVRLTASLANYGNTVVPGGQAELTITLLNPESPVGVARLELPKEVTAGDPLFQPIGAGYDSQGNFYTVNKNVSTNPNNRKIVKVAPDGTMTTVKVKVNGVLMDALPAQLTSPALNVFPIDARADAAGNVYILNSTSEIFTISGTDGTLTRRAHGVSDSPLWFDRDGQGNFFVVSQGGTFKLWKIPASGPATAYPTSGLSTPKGIVRSPDGNLYVTNSGDASGISRIAPDGTITPFVYNASVPAPAIALASPTGITVDASGNLYVANNGSGQVLKITPAGVVSSYASGIDGPTDLRFDAQGNLFVSATGDVGVWKVAPGGTAKEEWARTLISSPQGMQYDSLGNLYATSGVKLARKDPDDRITLLPPTFCNGREVAVGPSNEVYATSGCGDAIYRIVGSTSGVFVTGISVPNGVTVANGKLHASEANASNPRIVSYDLAQPSPAKVTVAESLVRTPKAVRIAANGDRYVLNADSIARIPAAGTAGSFVVGPAAFGFAAVSFAIAADGGYWIQESSAVRKLRADGTQEWTKTGLATLAYGVVGSGASVLVGDTTNRRIVRVDSAGTVTNVNATAFAVAPSAIVDDQAGGVLVALSSGHLVRVDSAGAVTALTTTALPAVPTRIAFDAAANRLYFVTGATSIGTFDVATKAVGTVPGISAAYSALEVSGGQLFATHAQRRELVSLPASGGTVTSLASGFVTPGAMVWTGSDIIFSDDSFTLRLVPGGNPTILLNERFSHLAWRNGTLYGTRGDANVYAFTPGVDAVSRIHLTPTGPSRVNLEGIAIRPTDGLMTVASSWDSSAWSFPEGSGQPSATFAGFSLANNVAIDGSGTVYVNSRGNSNVVKLAPGGRQSSVFASGIGLFGLAFGGDGTMYGATGTDVVRIASDGTWTQVAKGASGLGGLLVEQGGTYAVDQSACVVRKVEGTGFTTVAAGLLSPKGVRVASTGEVLVANQGNGTVVTFSNGKLDTFASNLNAPQAMAFLSSGELVVGGASGHVYTVSATGVASLVGDLPSLYGNNPNVSGSFAIDSMAVDPVTGRIGTVTLSRSQVDRIAYIPAGTGPLAGTVMDFRPRATFGDIAIGAVSNNLDFGTWTPPYAGDFQVKLKPVSTQVAGEANNLLHVGPTASANMGAVPALVQPGAPTVSVTVAVQGGDFTSVARPDPRSISVVVPEMFGSFIGTFGADSAGRIYATSGFASTALLRYAPGATTGQTYYTIPSGTITLTGPLPIDDAQNVYVSSNADVIRVSPAPGGATGVGTKIVTLPETVRRMARASDNTLYAAGNSTIYHLEPDGSTGNWKYSIVPTGVLGSVLDLTIDGKDNLYYRGGGGVNIVRKDGTRTNLVGANGAEPTFESEGWSLAGDCSDNLFITPYDWHDLGQSGEEHTLVHLIGRTGKPSSIFDGTKVRPALNDLDAIVFDRFSSSLLIWADTFRGVMYRMPVTCGVMDTDLHMVFPATHSAAGFSVLPKAVIPRADGSKEYVWSFKDVTASGKAVKFDATLANMQYGEHRAVASEAYLTFTNTFSAGDLKVPVQVPLVTADAMVDLGMAITGSTTDFPANTVVPGVVQVKNRNASASTTGKLIVEVTTTQGERLAVVSQQDVTMAPNQAIDVPAPFDTGTYLTGAYVLKATLTAANGVELAKGSATFYIVAGGATLAMSVSTDKKVYEASGTVSITGRVRNVSLNDLASGLTLRVNVRDPANTQILSATAPIDLLVPQAIKSSLFPLRLDRAMPGVYTIQATLMQGGVQVGATQEAAFSVLSTADTGTGLAGAISVTRSIMQGESATLTATTKNLGNATITDLAVSLQVGGFQQWSEPPFSLAPGETREVTRSWNTVGVADGIYAASATATVQGRAIPLGQDSIRVVADTVPDPFTFPARDNAPLDTAVESDAVLISGITTSVPISISGGAYRINGGAYTTASGTVAPGSQVQVRVQSASTLGTATSATLTVSNVSATFTVTTTSEDRTPDAFAFDAQSSVPRSTPVVSNEVVISGINVPVPVSAIGGEFSVNGGPFSTAPASVVAGDRVRARILSPAGFGATSTMTVTVSDATATFSVTTLAEDRDPAAFGFASRRNVPLATPVISASATITGINTSVPISVTGGEYRINGGAFTTAPGTVVDGDAVIVRVTSAATYATAATVTLTVSSVTASFTATTIPFELEPQVHVPRATLVESNAAVMRGTGGAAAIGIQGGEYRVNGGAYTAAAGTVHDGDEVTVRLLSSPTFATSATASLTVGDYTAPFTVTTLPFTFEAQSDVALSTVVTSNTATMAGISGATAAVSVTGGEYSVNGAAFTAAAGTVANGDQVIVRQTSSSAFSTKTTARLTVGDFTADFEATTLAEDAIPDPFAFTPQVDVPRSSVRTSNTVTVAGINTTVPIAVANGEYQVNGGTWTASPSLVANGDQVAVRVTSSGAFSTPVVATLSISGVSAGFSVTTLAEDLVPDAFGFAPQPDVPLSSVRTSNAVTITGINSAAPISVSGQGGATAVEYSVNGGPFTAAPGVVVNGDQVVVRQTASAAFSTTTTAVVTVSSVSGAFAVTTLAEDRVPDAFAFGASRNVPLATRIESPEITVSGINTTVPVSVAGGEYSLNGAAYTALAGNVSSGDRLRVRVMSSAAYATKTTVTITVSEATASFDATTLPFAFAPKVHVLPSTPVVSDPATMAGIVDTAPISVSAGEYSVNGGPFGTQPGSVRNGDAVTARQTSSASFATTTIAMLTVGDYTAPFAITTVPFLLPAELDVPLSTAISSEPATMAGIGDTAAISVESGEYSVNGGAFVGTAGSVRNGDVVVVRQTSSSSFSTKTTARLTVGDYTAPFEVTTLAEDRVPEPFSFAPKVNVPVGSLQTSEAVAILGINTGVPISVSGGEYSINGAPFTAAAGVVQGGDIVSVRQTASSSFATTTSAVLTVSGASASFNVTTVAVAQVNIALAPSADTRLLVLVSCRRSDEIEGSTDDTDEPGCLANRHAFLESYLSSLGFAHTIVDSNDAFRVELRSGRYNTYWVTGGADKFLGGTDQELVEAVMRGEALVVDGMHDERNKSLDPVLGFRYLGKPSGVTGATLGSSFLPQGTFNVYGHRPIRVELQAGAQQAVFNTGTPAIVANAWGYGKSLLFAFDLTGTLMAQSATALLTPMFEASLDYIAPGIPASFTGGAYVPLLVELHNTEPVPVDIQVTSAIPQGFQLAAGSPPAVLAGGSLTWTVTVPANASATLEWALRAPAASGSYAVTIEAVQTYNGSSVSQGTRTIPIQVRAAATELPQVVAAIEALTLASNKDDKARDTAVARLQEAQVEINRAAWDAAIGKLLAAAASLDDVQGVSVTVHLAAIGWLIQEMEQRWYQALPTCPATPACR